MPKASPTDHLQLALPAILDAVKVQIERSLTEPRRVLDPLRPLAKYPDKMTIAQVKTAWGCSAQHILNLIESGVLPAIDIKHPTATRHKWRLRREDVIAFEQTVLSTKKPS